MKQDSDYIYPETPEELSMFYGGMAEVKQSLAHEWAQLVIDYIDLKYIDRYDYRIPFPTINDLKVGDVVRTATGGYRKVYNEMELSCLKHDIGYNKTDVWGLVVGRNTLVKVKV